MDERWAPRLELIPEFIVTLARDRTILYVNRTTTVDRESLIGRKAEEFVVPAHRDRIIRIIEEVFTTGETREADIPAIPPANELYHSTYIPMFEDGQVVAVCTFSKDVSELRHAEALLTDRQGLLQGLLHVFPDMVFRVDANDIIVDFYGDPNETLLPPAEFLHKKIADVLPQDVAALLMDAVSRARRDGGVITVEYELFVRDQVRYYEARMVRSSETEVLSLVRDLTQQRQMEQRLMQADRIASLGALAAGVAHEINNPMTYVIGNLTLAMRELVALQENESLAPMMHELQKSLADARAGAERVRYIVSDLNTFSAAPRTDLTVVELRKVLDSAINMAWSEIRHRARLVRDYADVPGVLGNEHRLGQVFLNLLVNAAQAIEEGDAQKNTIHVRLAAEDGKVIVSIEDTGRGFDEALASRMFDPFFTTKPIGEGTGLGLAICRTIVGSLGGELIATSEGIGAGATFSVRLPATREPMEIRPARRQEPAPGEPLRGRILVIDDEPVIATLVRRALAEHEVYVVTSGRDALELCRAQAFDLILCDLLMPDVTGMDLYDELLSQGQRIEERILFMTAGAFTPRARRFLSRVTNPRLEKPFDVDELERAVQRALHGR
jgi:two-component system, cell cycle sensor histidine kinase and response regulator CckA